MKKWVTRIVVIIVVAIIALVGVKLYKQYTTPQKIHYHSGFVLFVNNKKIDFSSAKYMSVSPCVLHGNQEENTAPSEIQHDKAHLHDYVGDVVHTERTGAKWSDLFTNLNYPIDYAKATAYVNGQQLPDFQTQPILPDESIVIFVGKNDIQKDLKQAVTKQHIEQEAKKSEDCG